MRISYRANVILNSQKEPKETSQAAKSSLYFARLQSPIQGDSPHVYCLKLFDINCGWRCMHVIACGSILSRETRNKQSISWFWIRDINLIALHGIYQIHYDCQCLWHLVPNRPLPASSKRAVSFEERPSNGGQQKLLFAQKHVRWSSCSWWYSACMPCTASWVRCAAYKF